MDSFRIAVGYHEALLPGGEGDYQASFCPQGLAGMGHVVPFPAGVSEMRTSEMGLFPSDGVQGLAAGGRKPGYPQVPAAPYEVIA
jgi:hypothetical protein